MIVIRKANVDDIPNIMKFIDEHWKKGHIMATNLMLFRFQHVEDDEVHYIIAEDDRTKTIYGSMGYITMNSTQYPCISTVMICSLKNNEKRMLGEEMSRFFEKNIPCSNLISVGVSKRYAKTIEILAPQCIGKLRHYYRLNDIEKYDIAVVKEKVITKVVGKSKIEVFSKWEDISSCLSDDILNKICPYRDKSYIKHRYFEHPYYKYVFMGIMENERVQGLLIARECYKDDSKVLRIVDFVGDDKAIANIGIELDRLIITNDYEYVDFYCYGIDDEVMLNAGFVECKGADDNIIPDYFEPYEARNVDIYFYIWYKEGVKVFKAMGDQDRPSIL